MISNNERIDASELHNRLFNEDYYIIGTYQAEQELAEYGTFKAIDEVKQYEQDNFGEFNTEVNPEAILNMLAYIKGEEALNESEHLHTVYEDGELNKDDLIAIKAELEAQL